MLLFCVSALGCRESNWSSICISWLILSNFCVVVMIGSVYFTRVFWFGRDEFIWMKQVIHGFTFFY